MAPLYFRGRRLLFCQISLGYAFGVVSTFLIIRLGNLNSPVSMTSENTVPDLNRPDNFNPGEEHIADTLKKKVRLLCWVLTSSETLDTRAIHVKNTWGKRCDILLFASDKENKTFGTMPITTEPGYKQLPRKVNKALDYIYQNYLEKADWFVKCDDDTYLVVENLKYFLSSENSSAPVWYGHRFVTLYNSGGAGYVLSREALRRYGTRKPELVTSCSGQFFDAEDVMMGACLFKLQVSLGDTHDALNRSRFHCFEPEQHIKGGYHAWYYRYDAYNAKHGIEWMSEYPISFHYIHADMMYNIEYFLYKARPYGITRGVTELNKHNTHVKMPFSN